MPYLQLLAIEFVVEITAAVIGGVVGALLLPRITSGRVRGWRKGDADLHEWGVRRTPQGQWIIDPEMEALFGFVVALAIFIILHEL